MKEIKQQYGEVKIGVEEIFWYDPNTIIVNVCSMCSRNDCPVPDKNIVSNCNSFIFVEIKPKISTDYRIIQGMTVSNNPIAYLSNCAS